MGAPGWDDARRFDPVILPGDAPDRQVTLVFPYYDNPLFLAYQLQGFAMLHESFRRRLALIIVDDGSPNVPAERVMRVVKAGVETRLFRIEVDVRWNWLAARNIGAHEAPPGWLAMTDIDHVWPTKALDMMISRQFDPGTIYRFWRREWSGESIHPHPNTFFIERDTFWRVGGYDERLSGHYGTDGDWRRRCAATAPVRTLPAEIERWEHFGDSSTQGYKRKQPEDAGKKAIIAARKNVKAWRPLALSYPYHQVLEL